MIPPVILWLAGAALRVITAIAQPRTARCSPGWYVEGVRPSGASSCVLAAADRRGDDTRDGCAHEHLELPSLPLHVWCAADERAVVIDERTIGCRKDARS